MLRHLRPPVVMLLAFTLITGITYPLAITGFAWIMLHENSLGSLVERDGRVVGSRLVGQAFTSERYFHPRPSATDPPYNGAASTGSNLGPTNRKLIEQVKNNIVDLGQAGGAGLVPADAVTTSASGLDPDISTDAALLQVPRVARARNLAPDRVLELVRSHTAGRTLGFLGEPRINVLALNLALDEVRR